MEFDRTEKFGVGGAELEVAGQFTDRDRESVGSLPEQLVGDPMVHRASSGPADRVDDRRTHERVRERESIDPAFFEQSRVGASLECFEHGVLACVDHPGQQRDVDVATDHGGPQEHPARNVGDPGEAIVDDTPDAVGNPDGVEVDGGRPPSVALGENTGVDQVERQLAAEERIATRLGVDHRRELGPDLVQRVPGGGLDEIEHGLFVEVRELDTMQPLWRDRQGWSSPVR